MSKKVEELEEVDSDEEVENLANEVEDASIGEPEPEEDCTLANSDVVTKYQEAAKIANAVIAEISALVLPGAQIIDLCKAGDSLIETKTASIFKNKGKNGKVVEKGVAFPVCISVNEIVCNYSPLESEGNALPPLVVGDVVKIDLGVHIDGYIAVAAHTVVVSEPGAAPALSPRLSQVLTATWLAAEVSARLMVPGNTNEQVTSAIAQIASLYGLNAISGVQMHQMKRYVIDGNKRVQLREGDDGPRPERCTFEPNEVYMVDVCLSSGEGKARDTGLRTTVHKRSVDRKYALKQKTSRAFFNEVLRKAPTLPFSLRNISDEKTAKMGVRECVNHDLLTAFTVASERSGDLVAHFKFTVLLMPSGTLKVTGTVPPVGLLAEDAMEGEEALFKPLPEALSTLLAAGEEAAKKKNKKKAKKAAKKATEGTEEA